MTQEEDALVRPSGQDADVTRLALAAATDLFVAPVPDPLAGRFAMRSGMELLTGRVDPRRSDPLTIEIEFGDDEPPSAGRLRVAIAGYCAERLDRIDVERAAIRRRGLKELLVGLLFLGACLAVAALLASSSGPSWARTFFSEGLIIVGWIALWHPVDMLFFERLPLLREQRVLRRIQNADVLVLP